ncbi:MAG: rhodanese-like domain-containing protein, partial [Candidatus Wallbacteria bacterium]|nr:rhodanese-like domain-containing protein [Candidatus Wallbacteria bacterium]
LSHSIRDVDEVIQHILSSHEADSKLEIGAREAAEKFRKKEIRLLDVRTEEEWQLAHIEGAQLVNEQVGQEIMTQWAKDTPMVLHCHHGIRSLDAVSFLIGHGFTNVRSMIGGIDAWSLDVDQAVPRY